MPSVRARRPAALLVTLALAVTTCGCAASPPGSAVPDATGRASTPGDASSATARQTVLGPGQWRTLRVAVPDDVRYRSVLVYTPDVRDPDVLPVLYLLHGLPANVAQLCDAQTGHTLDTAFEGGAEPFIMACPDASQISNRDSEWADSTDGRDHLETFVTQQARRAVEGDHPRPRSMRAIGGFSMGGFGAAAIALRHADLYSQVVPLAGYFVIDDPDKVFGATAGQAAAHDPTDLVAHAQGQHWDLYEADHDSNALTDHAATRFAPLLRESGAVVKVFITSGLHSNQWAVQQLPAAARLLSISWGSG